MSSVTFSTHFVDSNPRVDFIKGILARVDGSVASDYADIQMVKGADAINGSGSCIIESIRLLSQEATDWRVEFWDKSLPNATGADLLNWGLLGAVDLYRIPPSSQTGAYQATYYAVATLNCYLASGLSIPYKDREGKGQMHVNLCVLGGTAKSAGDVGQVQLKVGTIAAS